MFVSIIFTGGAISVASLDGTSTMEITSEDFDHEVCLLQLEAYLHPVHAQGLSAAVQLDTSKVAGQSHHEFHKYHGNLLGIFGVSMVYIFSILVLPLLMYLCSSNNTETMPAERMLSMQHVNTVWHSALLFFGSAFTSLAYAAAIPDSYDLTKQLGADGALSGLIVSSMPIGSVFGFFFVRGWIIYRAVTYHWWWIMGTVCMGIGSIVYLISGLSDTRPCLALFLILASRVVIGLGAGVSNYIFSDVKMRLFPPEDIPTAQLLENLGSVFGLGGGPILSNIVQHMLDPFGIPDLIAMTISGSLFTIIGTVPLCELICYCVPADGTTDSPIMGSVMSSDVGEPGMGVNGTNDRLSCQKMHQTMVMVSGTVLIFIMQFLCQTVDIGSSLIFEISFYWRSEDLGIAIGLAILAAVPLAAGVGRFVKTPPEKSIQIQRTQWCYFMCCLSTLLFYPFHVFGVPDWVRILIADMLSFTFGTVVLSQIQATCYAFADVDIAGKWSTPNIAALGSLSMLGRGLAGPLSRSLLDPEGLFHKHQVTYTIFLACTVFLSLAIMTLFFRPAVGELQANMKQLQEC
jgi:hypothetical protein